MTPLQVRILRALDVPMRWLALSEAMPEVLFRDLASALRGAQSHGWVAIGETVGGHVSWSRTMSGSVALWAATTVPAGGVVPLPVDPPKAFDKIAEGLNEALAFAQGDARSAIVIVPVDPADERAAAAFEEPA